jgi:hypothetical protein
MRFALMQADNFLVRPVEEDSNGVAVPDHGSDQGQRPSGERVR